MSFRELDLTGVAHRFALGRDEAERIARVVAAIGRHQGRVDFDRVAAKRDVIRRAIQERIAGNPFIRHVEVRDRAARQILFVAQPSEAVRTEPAALGQDVAVEIDPVGRGPGEVRVAVAEESFQRQVRELRIKVGLAAALGIGVLLVGFVYVLHLIRKNKRLEQSRLAAERRSYVGLLASGLAHEIRNPLNAMNMNLQMLEEEIQGVAGLDGSEPAELLGSTKSEIKRLERLVNNFLAFARPGTPRFETCDLNQVLQEVARFLQADFQQSRVNLQLDVERLLPTVEVDETQLKQALMNLLVNARQVLKAGGTVVLRSRAAASGEVLVEVQDDGPGIPPDAVEKIFEVFYSNRGGGTGLGLPIARQIVERHGGRIEVESAVGRGTTFRIRLPRRHERAEAVSGERPRS